jgi:hypothetical protein
MVGKGVAKGEYSKGILLPKWGVVPDLIAVV